jgi:hypothetical protein
MPKKKPPKREPEKKRDPLEQVPTKDLLQSIRRDLAEVARRAGLDPSESPPKPPKP